MQSKFERLLAMANEISDLGAAQSLLGWDLHTYMPSGAAEDRGYQQAALARIIHARNTSPELGELLEDLIQAVDKEDPDSDQACLVRLMHKEYSKNLKIDPKWVEEFQQVSAKANLSWRKAREESDFSLFQPMLVKLVEMAQQYAHFFSPFEHVYDPLLDEFEPGVTTAEVQRIFNEIRPQQIELIRAISEKPALEDSFLFQSFPQPVQQEVSMDVITHLGYDWLHGRMDSSAHPFTSGFGIGDVRITTRFDPNALPAALFASIHECGHALYELGVSPDIARTALAEGASSAFHESQSRMYENLVGRSMPFWQFYYPKLLERFPAQLGNVSLESFYAAINRVKPSFIRVEADEATYNLHIMLRMELEIALLEGSLPVSELPQVWNERMQAYLGITPPDDAQGVLQDIHWSMGLMGYFSTYALGNLIASQLWEKIQADIPDIEQHFIVGDFMPLLDWLRQNVHRHGRKYTPLTLIKKITGTSIDPAPYMRYLQTKYGELYKL